MHIQAYGFHVGVTYNTSEENILKNPVLRLLKSHHTMAGDSLLILRLLHILCQKQMNFFHISGTHPYNHNKLDYLPYKN